MWRSDGRREGLGRDELGELAATPGATSAQRPPRVLSARKLLSGLEGAERERLEAAMKARDLDAVRALLRARQAEASLSVPEWAPGVAPPLPMMRPRGSPGGYRPRPRRGARGPTAG